MTADERLMNRCLDLARLGLGETAPNPMVGSVVVHNGKIIGEGFHRKFGSAHAEVNAIGSVKNPEILKKSTLYVSLEPCSHKGKTPPCTDLIIKKRIPKVIIGTEDPFPEVSGKGIEKLKRSGVEVVAGILDKNCKELNIRFFTFYEKRRPYIILKWAQTLDGFVDRDRGENEKGSPSWITGDLARRLVHKFRAEEAAILVGTNTIITDNASLTTRDWSGSDPLRIVIDRNLKLPHTMKVFEPPARTVVVNSLISKTESNLVFTQLNFDQDIIPQLLEILYQHGIQSLIVEGGPFLLTKFIEKDWWDEARVFYGNTTFGTGIKAPYFNHAPVAEEWLNNDVLKVYRHPGNGFVSGRTLK